MKCAKGQMQRADAKGDIVSSAANHSKTNSNYKKNYEGYSH